MLVGAAREKPVALEEMYESKRARGDGKKGKEEQKKYQKKEPLRVQKTATKTKKQSTSGKGKGEEKERSYNEIPGNIIR